LIASHAHVFIDDEDARRLAQAMGHEITKHVASVRLSLHMRMLSQLLRGSLFQPLPQRRLIRKHSAELTVIDAQYFGCNRSVRAHRANSVARDASRRVEVTSSGAVRQHCAALRSFSG